MIYLSFMIYFSIFALILRKYVDYGISVES